MSSNFNDIIDKLSNEYADLLTTCEDWKRRYEELYQEYNDLLSKVDEEASENALVKKLKEQIALLEAWKDESLHIGNVNKVHIEQWMLKHSSINNDESEVHVRVSKIRMKMKPNQHFIVKYEYIPLLDDDCLIVHCSCGEKITLYV